ncbi:hypothetical protein JCM18901_1003 [Psychrobacter sp. JCM 18901]|uniref:hypothetical protein n=1 Tax=Psychrobacter sp. JCM 18901 TaxID=1298609 RepID=UPI0004332B1C|nr:hypothetical protein [Psychrobacter sp. JCM 18901]GAF55360.1 hypothetical protein JCM18901_1003 [Psychrobacter sp. JCM 18901]
MGIKIEWSMTQNAWDKRVCKDYWAYNHKISYVDYVRMLCQKYNISSQTLFETISQCYACLDDVCCEYCGSACPIEVPADIAIYGQKRVGFVQYVSMLCGEVTLLANK